MARKRIENPKVFLSYAWGEKEYQNMVLAFATQLVRDGIDVVFDKWDLAEGNDTNAFMEKCVNDPTITNVLMLLDPLYATKANEHAGGVGTETQIISAKVYSEVEQSKFIPVVMKRDPEGNVCKPTYLQTRLHFDLSIPERYDEEYKRLVKTLYGEEVYPKPELGNKPSWVEKPIAVKHRELVTYDTIRGVQPNAVKRGAFITYLKEISNDLITFCGGDMSGISNPNDYISQYDETESIRTRFLQLLKYSGYVENSRQFVADFFEETANGITQASGRVELARIRLHELLIYVIAFFLRGKDYSSIGYILGKTYYNCRRSNSRSLDSFKMFYSGSDHEKLDIAVRKRDNKRYITGTGQHWLETLATDLCSKEQFILADIICFNYSVYGAAFDETGIWFPITYIFDSEYNSVMGAFSKKLISREYAQELLPLFGYKTVDELKAKMKSVEDSQSERRETRYSDAFESAPLLCDFIKAGDVGIRR